jgi:hypothetical protein
VHVALPLGHNDGPVKTVLLLGSGVAFLWLARRAVLGRRWRGLTALLLVATMVAYLVVVGTEGEEPDQVGIATAMVELLALALIVIPTPGHRWTARGTLLRPLANTGVVLSTLVFGTAVWLMFAAGHDDHHVTTDADAGHEHGEYLARAQAGILMRPAGPAPDGAQQRAALDLAARTRADNARYRDYRTAEADGYLPTAKLAGLEVHFERKANGRDGRVTDPRAPEQLVYAFDHGKGLLIGVVYQMERAGVPGPAVGGSATRWHAHNVCVGVLPLGFGVVSPFGGCPFLTASLTFPDMIHVWTVDAPGGPYAEHLEDSWVRALIAREGIPVTT